MLLNLLPLLSTALIASGVHSLSPSCSCSSGFIPVPVDVTIPVDPANPEGLNTTNTFRLKTTFDVFGVLCEPVSSSSSHSAIQLLLHGFTYTHQYWDVTWGGFQNYSYVAHSCDLGIASFAYDNIDAGQSIRQNSTHAQSPTAASVSSSLARDLKSGRISQLLTGSSKEYSKVVAIGHSLGSATLNIAAIADGPHSPFDGMILTGARHSAQDLTMGSNLIFPPASQVNPGRWGNLDSGYLSTSNISQRSLFYGPNGILSFSPIIQQLDELTKDAGSEWMAKQVTSMDRPALGFRGPVAVILGSLDTLFCLPPSPPCEQPQLQLSESQSFPDSRNVTTIVIDNSGHDINLHYAAAEEFTAMIQLFEQFVAE